MSGIDRRSFFKIVATSGAAAAAGGLQPAGREAHPLRRSAGQHRPGRGRLLLDRLPRVPGGLRRHREEPRRPRHQARGQSRPSREPGRALHPRPGRAPGALPSRPLPRRPASAASPWRGTRPRSRSPTSWARWSKARQGQRIALVTGLETGTLARLMDEWVKALGRAAAHRLRAARLRGHARGEPHRVRPRRHSRLRDRGGRATWSPSAPTSWRRGCHRWATRSALRADARLPPRAGRDVRARRAAACRMTAANADEWLRNAPGTEGAARARHAAGDRGRGAAGAGRRRRPLAPRPRAPTSRRPPRASGVPADDDQAHRPRSRRVARPASCVGGGAAATGTQRHRHARGGQPAERRRSAPSAPACASAPIRRSAGRARTRTCWR